MSSRHEVIFGTGPPGSDFDLSRMSKGLDNIGEVYLRPWQEQALESLRRRIGDKLQGSDTFQLVVTDREHMVLDLVNWVADDVRLYKTILDDLKDLDELRSSDPYRDQGGYDPTDNDLKWAEGAAKKYLR